MEKTKITIIALAVLSLFSSVPLISQDAWCLDRAERESFISALPRGETFENDGNPYVWLPTLRGEKTGSPKATEKTAKSTVAIAEKETTVEQKGPYTIYGPSSGAFQSTARQGYSAQSANGTNSGCPIALNTRTKSLAIITGNIWLKLKNIQDAKTIGDEYGLTFSFSNAAMSTSFYQVPADTDIATLRQSLQADSRILRVTLDMVDRIHNPR